MIVSGKTTLNHNDSILSGVDISLQNFDNVIHTTRSNESGYYQIAIPGEYKFAEHLRIVAGENLIFNPFAKNLDFPLVFIALHGFPSMFHRFSWIFIDFHGFALIFICFHGFS